MTKEYFKYAYSDDEGVDIYIIDYERGVDVIFSDAVDEPFYSFQSALSEKINSAKQLLLQDGFVEISEEEVAKYILQRGITRE